MRNVTVKYLRENNRTGSFEYRRRVPKVLEGMVKQREFLKVLGKTQGEAVMHYGREHERIEHMISLAKHGVTGLSPLEQSTRLTALLESWGADPHSRGRDGNERTWREEAAAQLVDRYQDPRTGDYVGVPEEDGALAGALLGGVSNGTPEVTVTDAFAAWGTSLCRREGISQGIYYKWSKDFMEAGKRRLAGDTARAATTDEVKDLRREARDLKEVVAEQTLELRLPKKA